MRICCKYLSTKLLINVTTYLTLSSCSSISQNDSHSPTQNKNAIKEIQNMHQVASKDGTIISYSKNGTGWPLLFVHSTSYGSGTVGKGGSKIFARLKMQTMRLFYPKINQPKLKINKL